jgi:hypothetical protein
MFPFILFRDEGDAGGGEGAAGAASGSQSTNDDAKIASSTDKIGDKPKGGETSKPKGESKTPTIESLTEELNQVKSKLGKQGNELGNYKKESDTFRKIVKGLTTDPNATLATLAKKYGAKVKFAADEDDLEKVLMSDDPDLKTRLLESRKFGKSEQNTESSILNRLNPVINHLLERDLAREYPDYDELADEREHLETLVGSGTMTQPELFQLAARGKYLKEALAKAKEDAIAEYKTMLDKKHREQLDTSGDKSGNKQDIDFADVAKELNKFF